MTDPRPRFASFDEAWSWFLARGSIENHEEHRERFTQGRAQFLTFQVRVEAPQALTLVERVHDALEEADEILPQEREHLHISVRGCGFQVLKRQRPDDVLREDVLRMSERAAAALKPLGRFDAVLGPLNVFPDALVLEVHDGGRLAEARGALRAAVSDDSLIDDEHYLPHCTVAGFAADSLSDGTRTRIADLRALEPVSISVGRIELARWWFTGFDDRESVEMETARSYRLR